MNWQKCTGPVKTNCPCGTDYFLFSASGRHALYLNDNLHWGTSEVVTTYLNRRLSGTEEFQCAEVELWGLTSWEESSL